MDQFNDLEKKIMNGLLRKKDMFNAVYELSRQTAINFAKWYIVACGGEQTTDEETDELFEMYLKEKDIESKKSRC